MHDWYRFVLSSLREHAAQVSETAQKQLSRDGISDDAEIFTEPSNSLNNLRSLPLEQAQLLLKNSISPLPLHKALVLFDSIHASKDETYKPFELLAFAKILVACASNLKFGPEVGLGEIKNDAPVIAPWLRQVRRMASDLEYIRAKPASTCIVHYADARQLDQLLMPQSVDAVITSPPYPNEKDYTRTTRLETVLLGFIKNKKDLRNLKQQLIRSNTRGVYKGDDDDKWITNHEEIHRIAESIERRRISLGKTSGFERLYPKVTRLYFGGMAKHLASLRKVLKPGALLAYVVGDQASYLRVMIRTGELLADIARSLGYELIDRDLFRTRLATATKEQLREEVVLLRWPGQ